MQKYLYSVYDLKAKAYGNPFTAVNRGVATRDFATAVNDPNTHLYKYPEDFVLYCLGKFDDVLGTLEPFSTIEVIANGPQFKTEV